MVVILGGPPQLLHPDRQMLEHESDIFTQECHRVLVGTRDNQNSLVGREHPVPEGKGSTNLGDASLPRLPEDYKPMLTEGGQCLALVLEWRKGNNASRRVLGLGEILQEERSR